MHKTVCGALRGVAELKDAVIQIRYLHEAVPTGASVHGGHGGGAGPGGGGHEGERVAWRMLYSRSAIDMIMFLDIHHTSH